MALEPITRQEQIIAGKDLEPITRMERFLKEYGGGGGASSWNDLDDRPFGEETTYGDTLTWDGNTEGLTETEVGYCISEQVVTLDDLANGYTITADGEVMLSCNDNSTVSAMVEGVMYSLGDILYLLVNDYEGVPKGVYCPFVAPVTLKINDATTVKPIDNKYLEPFETVGGDTLTWDGNTEGRYMVNMGTGTAFVHVSDATPTLDDFKNGISYVTNTINGKVTETVAYSGDNFMDLGGGALSVPFGAVIPTDNHTDSGLTFEKKGCYFIVNDSASTEAVTIPNYTGFTTTKLKEEYIPVDYIKQLIAEVTGN